MGKSAEMANRLKKLTTSLVSESTVGLPDWILSAFNMPVVGTISAG